MKTPTFKAIVFILGFLFGFSALSSSVTAIEVNENGEVIEPSGKGAINWTTRKLEACGIADPDQPVYGQVKAAQLAARAELLAILRGIRIRGEYGVIQGILRKDISEANIEGFLANSYVTRPMTNELGLIEAKAFVYLDRQGNTLLMPKNVVSSPDTRTWHPPETITPSSAQHTGLIIDARGLELKPAMAPRILVEGELLELYGSEFAAQKADLTNGFAEYAGTIHKANAMKKRIGENPLIVKATTAVNVTDVVISREDAIEIASALKAYDFFKERRVVIVVN